MVLKRRHLAKALTWRIGGTIITSIVAIAVTGNTNIGMIVGPLDFMVKVILYYLHERLWMRIQFGVRRDKYENCYCGMAPRLRHWKDNGVTGIPSSSAIENADTKTKNL